MTIEWIGRLIDRIFLPPRYKLTPEGEKLREELNEARKELKEAEGQQAERKDSNGSEASN